MAAPAEHVVVELRGTRCVPDAETPLLDANYFAGFAKHGEAGQLASWQHLIKMTKFTTAESNSQSSPSVAKFGC
jgi:hypothetical protein